MNIRKFTGATSRDALKRVREALGHDAVVLSNRNLDDGSVEIVALADAELKAVAPAPRGLSAAGAAGSRGAAAAGSRGAAAGAPSAASVTSASRVGGNPYAGGDLPDVFSSVFGASADASDVPPAAPGDAMRKGAMPVPAQPAAASEPAPWLVEHAKRLTEQRDALARPRSASVQMDEERAFPAQPDSARDAVRSATRPTTAAHTARASGHMPAGVDDNHPAAARPNDNAAALADAVKAHIERIVDETVMQELGALRGMITEQFDGLMWRDRQGRSSVHAALTKRLFAAGFSAQLVRMIVDRLPEGDGTTTLDQATDWARSVLAANLPVLDSEDALMERGGVFALMGPTGVGKTTTTAKLAARCVMRFGASKVALLTTDSYRIGGHEQLRIFGKILGVPVHAVKDAGDLQFVLSELRNKHIVLIDTIGMSQRDRAVSDQIAMLHGAGTPVQRLLLLNATCHGDTLNEVVQAYRNPSRRTDAAAPPDLAGCVLTKLDEATNLGGALDTVIRYKLPVHYVSTGQKVPENLYVATKSFLLKSAFCVPRDGSPFVPHEDEMPALMAALAARAGAEPHEVRFG